MYRILKILFALIFSSSYAAGSSVSPYFSNEQKRQAFSISEKKYQDIRYDFNHDNKVDVWSIKKGPINIRVQNFSNKVIFQITKFQNGSASERVVVSQGGKLYLVHSQERKIRLYYKSDFAGLCVEKVQSDWSKVQELLKPISSKNLSKCAEKYLDDSCQDSASFEVLKDALTTVYAPPSPTKNDILSCLEGEDSKRVFETRFGKEKGAKEHLQAVVLYKNTILNFLSFSSTDEKAIISCKPSGSNEKPKALETGQIQIVLAENNQDAGSQSLQDSIKSQIFHETVHTSSVEDESVVLALTSMCVKKKNYNDVVKNVVPGISMYPTNAEKAAETASLKASDVIPASIAEAPKPLPPSGSPQEMNRVAEALGSEQTLKISQSQTSGVIKMAESVLASTPAVAAPVSNTLASTTSKSSSSRLPASEPTYSTNTKAPSNPALKNLQKNSTSGKAREYITEEIDLTKQQMVGSTASSASANRVAQAANSKATTASTSVGAPEVSTSTDTPTASTGSPRGNLNASGSGGGAISTGNTRTNNRGVASSGAASSQNEVREEIASSFLDKPYQEARKQLKNRAFVETLERNDITVYDLQGQSFGAPKGKIIFIDKGNRFDRKTRP